jgi:hypothetical protein
LLWPADEPWPHCDAPHVWDGVNPAISPQDTRRGRHILTAAASRPRGTPRFTPEESAALDRINESHLWPEYPVPMLPVAQLYTRDIPGLRPPGRADLLQFLWCPFDHGMKPYPRPSLHWRTAATVTSVLADPPEPPSVQYGGYLPEPCLLHPEQVTEYPDFMELSQDLQEQVRQWGKEQTGGTVPDSSSELLSEVFYEKELAVAPGWKAGGWPRWGLTDPSTQSCPACGSGMLPFLTVASVEWDRSSHSWIPYEDQAHASDPVYLGARHPGHPAMVQIADNNCLQFYTCPASPDHPYTEQVQ